MSYSSAPASRKPTRFSGDAVGSALSQRRLVCGPGLEALDPRRHVRIAVDAEARASEFADERQLDVCGRKFLTHDVRATLERAVEITQLQRNLLVQAR